MLTPRINECLWFLLGGLIAGNVFAQPMVEVEMQGQPLTYSKSGVTDGCGIRVVGLLPNNASPKGEIKTFDVSANYWVGGNAAVKMIGEATSFDGIKAGNSKHVPLYGGWLKAEGKTPAAPGKGGFTASKESGSYLFPVQPEGALDFIFAGTGVQRVQIAVAWVKGIEWVYYGTIKLSESEREQILSCMKEVLK